MKERVIQMKSGSDTIKQRGKCCVCGTKIPKSDDWCSLHYHNELGLKLEMTTDWSDISSNPKSLPNLNMVR